MQRVFKMHRAKKHAGERVVYQSITESDNLMKANTWTRDYTGVGK